MAVPHKVLSRTIFCTVPAYRRLRSIVRGRAAYFSQLDPSASVESEEVALQPHGLPRRLLGQEVRTLLTRLIQSEYQVKIVTEHLSTVDYHLATVVANVDILCSLLDYSFHIKDCVCNHPQLLTADLVGWKGVLSTYLYSDADWADLMSRHPDIFYSKNGPDNAFAVLAVICLQYKISRESVKRNLLDACPEFLKIDLTDELLPALKGLERLAGGKQGTVKLVSRYPRLVWIASGAKPQLEEKIEYLYKLGFTAEQCRRIIQACPKFLLVSLHYSIKPKLKFLSEQFKLDPQQLVRVISSNPQILTVSTVELKRKWRFLAVLQCTTEDLLDCPDYLTASIYDDLGPAFYYVTQKSCKDALKDETTKRISLSKLLKFTALICKAPPYVHRRHAALSMPPTDSAVTMFPINLIEYVTLKQQWQRDVGRTWRTTSTVKTLL